jgi:hypothetical protein
MAAINHTRRLAFADDYLEAVLIENVVDCPVSGIVVNLDAEPVLVEGAPPSPIRPWRSLTATNGRVRKAGRIAVLKVRNLENLGGVALRGWSWFGDIYGGFPRQTPLYMSAIDTVGQIDADPHFFTGERAVSEVRQTFELKLKCWWSPNETDCFIHNEHPFLEVHTQIHGFGRMQKFRERDAATVYEDVVMAPGFTHEAFCVVAGRNQWAYPWHRYYTDTESIWLAIELHPL